MQFGRPEASGALTSWIARRGEGWSCPAGSVSIAPRYVRGCDEAGALRDAITPNNQWPTIGGYGTASAT